MFPFNKTTILFFFAVAMMALVHTSCTNEGNSQTASASANSDNIDILKKVPELLDRHEKLRNGKEWDNVQNLYGKARAELVKDPTAKEPWLDLAEIFMQEARITGEHPHYYPAALQALGELLKKDFDDKNIHDKDLKFRALSDKAAVELSLHEFAKALATAKEAVAINPHNAGIYGALVDANVELGNYEEAVKMADKMVSIRPDLRSYSRISYLREIHGDVKGAEEAMKMAVEAGYPTQEQTAWTMLTLGDMLREYGNAKDAELAYRAILQDRPDYPFAIAALGDLELDKKNYKKAEELLNQAAAIIPEVGFYESLAELYQATGRQDEFKKTLAEVIAMMEDDAAHGHNMDLEFAHVYSDLANDQSKALEYAMKEYNNRPENIMVNGTLAKIYTKMGDKAKAKTHLDKALRTGTKKPELIALK